ncbi:MAG TPA: hypothetical protein VGD14_02105, partial [bacterium]
VCFFNPCEFFPQIISAAASYDYKKNNIAQARQSLFCANLFNNLFNRLHSRVAIWDLDGGATYAIG